MAGYTNPAFSRHPSFDHFSLGYDAYDNTPLGRQLVSESSMSHVTSDGDKVNIFIIFVFILELLVLVFVSVLEYFLRVTDVFPVRRQNFSCNDTELSYKTSEGELTYDSFAYDANIAYEIIIPLSFCIPPVMILISEIALWAFSDERQKTVRALCRSCRLPQILRRMIRYIGSFIFGLLITMIFVDVTKLFVGRLRPNFLEICKPDVNRCKTEEWHDVDICTETDAMLIRQARLSFPSLHAAMTAFSACFLAVYIHHIIRASSVRILRPFLALGFILLSVMCCLTRYGLHYSYWTDVITGFVLGVLFALYICVFVLDNFHERVSSQQLYQHIRAFMYEQRHLELHDLYKEGRLRFVSSPGAGVYAGGIILPRPRLYANGVANESNTDETVLTLGEVERVYHPYSTHSMPAGQPTGQSAPAPRDQPSPHSPPPDHNTFQRELQRSIDHYRHINHVGHL